MKDSGYVKINSVSPLYLIIDKVDGYIEEKNVYKYFILTFTENNKEALTKHTKLWDKIKTLIEKVNIKLNEYGNDFMKTKFNLDDNLPLNKTLKLLNLTIIVRSVFQEDNKYYPQVFLDECLYKLLKCSNMKELMFQK